MNFTKVSKERPNNFGVIYPEDLGKIILINAIEMFAVSDRYSVAVNTFL